MNVIYSPASLEGGESKSSHIFCPLQDPNPSFFLNQKIQIVQLFLSVSVSVKAYYLFVLNNVFSSIPITQHNYNELQSSAFFT